MQPTWPTLQPHDSPGHATDDLLATVPEANSKYLSQTLFLQTLEDGTSRTPQHRASEGLVYDRLSQFAKSQRGNPYN